jgi:hypothetical protein
MRNFIIYCDDNPVNVIKAESARDAISQFLVIEFGSGLEGHFNFTGEASVQSESTGLIYEALPSLLTRDEA